ncbi:hypothetical protein SAMN04490243_1042 [Robiginitalea myxolifaciens]|uniref:Uncharacterized protein n=2 Tax=Robiginitalea myxolifaciens TaxID=400055 RepID=A0A1I6G0Q9_9FLAO|nr:hypothetical protein SAMN04490243_1042 [Robiginitalea myxolifaciens]
MPLLFSGCFIGRLFQDTTVKRYRSVSYQEITDTRVPLVDISVFTTRIKPDKPIDRRKTLWDLDGEGEAKLIEVLSQRYDSNEVFVKSLGNEFFKTKNNLVTDYSTQNLRIVLSVAKNRRYGSLGKGFSLADRIEYLKINIRSDSSGIHFTKWNKFETEYGTVNIGDVTFNESISLTGGLGGSRTSSNSFTTASESDSATNGVTAVVTPTAAVTGGNSVSEVQKLGYRFLALNGRINNDSLVLEQEGIRDIDLAGNIILDVEVRFDSLQTEPFFQLEGFDKPNGNGQKVGRIEVLLPKYRYNQEDIFPTYTKEVKVPILYKYVYRHVKNTGGAKTFYEWDDDVVYYDDEVLTVDHLLMREKDYLPEIYFIGMNNQRVRMETDQPNTIGLFFRNRLSGKVDNIQSLDVKELRNFMTYLQQKSMTQVGQSASSNPIVFGNYELVSQEQRFWQTDSEFNPVTWQTIRENRDELYVDYAFNFDNITRYFFAE